MSFVTLPVNSVESDPSKASLQNNSVAGGSLTNKLSANVNTDNNARQESGFKPVLSYPEKSCIASKY